MTTYSVALNRDTEHEGPQWWAEVLEIAAEGTVCEHVETLHATTWYATSLEADREGCRWLMEHKAKPALALAANLNAMLATLTDEQRVEALRIAWNGYCQHCGSVQPEWQWRCQCQNDE